VYRSKKERLYVRDLIPEPALTYPAYYLLSQTLLKNENLQQAIIDLHSYSLENYTKPSNFEDIFNSINCGYYLIFKEAYIVGYMGGKLMYLESAGWKKLPATKDIFKLENWLILQI